MTWRVISEDVRRRRRGAERDPLQVSRRRIDSLDLDGVADGEQQVVGIESSGEGGAEVGVDEGAVGQRVRLGLVRGLEVFIGLLFGAEKEPDWPIRQTGLEPCNLALTSLQLSNYAHLVCCRHPEVEVSGGVLARGEIAPPGEDSHRAVQDAAS